MYMRIFGAGSSPANGMALGSYVESIFTCAKPVKHVVAAHL
jgi:hypothetical protein